MLHKLRTKSVHVRPLADQRWETTPPITPLQGFRHDRQTYGLRTALYNLWWLLTH